MAIKTLSHLFQVGDRVAILHSAGLRGRIVEARGPLGPGGMLIYRVRVPRKPKPTYIELGADQLAAVLTPPVVGPSPLRTTQRPKLQPPKLKPRTERRKK